MTPAPPSEIKFARSQRFKIRRGDFGGLDVECPVCDSTAVELLLNKNSRRQFYCWNHEGYFGRSR